MFGRYCLWAYRAIHVQGQAHNKPCGVVLPCQGANIGNGLLDRLGLDNGYGQGQPVGLAADGQAYAFVPMIYSKPVAHLWQGLQVFRPVVFFDGGDDILESLMVGLFADQRSIWRVDDNAVIDTHHSQEVVIIRTYQHIA